jgi:oxygen-dependent protoporphyrinogen oxidase
VLKPPAARTTHREDRLRSCTRLAKPDVHDSVRQVNLVHQVPYALSEATPAAPRLRAGLPARPPGPVDYAGDWITRCPSSEAAVRAGARAASSTLARLSTTPRFAEAIR